MDSVNVSLEPHLRDHLRAVRPMAPTELGAELSAYIDGQPPKEIIPYGLLQRLSQWSRSKEGGETLKSKAIDPGTLSMISLLAGTTSSPEKNFGVYVPPKEPEEVAHDQAKERKSITALVNAVFSVFGAGFAAWWGADKTGWRDEYKVLFALGVGIIVAISEALLYLIWTSRKTSSRAGKTRRLLNSKSNDKKSEDVAAGTADDETKIIAASSKEEKTTSLRQRRDTTR